MLRRSPDPVSLVFGLAFTGLGLTLLADHGDLHVHPRWVWPGVLIVLAIALIAGIRPHRAPTDQPPPPPPPSPAESGTGGAAEGL